MGAAPGRGDLTRGLCDDVRQATSAGDHSRGDHLERAHLAFAESYGGHIKIHGLREISFAEITPALARETGFAGVVDLLKVARHGTGERVFLVSFEYCAAAQ